MHILALSLPIQIHLVAAVLSVGLGPFVLLARKRSPLHRGLGFTGVTAMVVTAVSSFWIHSPKIPGVHGFSAIHMLSVVTLLILARGLWAVMHGRIRQHRRSMLFTYAGLVIAGGFAFMPDRFLGQLI